MSSENRHTPTKVTTEWNELRQWQHNLRDDAISANKPASTVSLSAWCEELVNVDMGDVDFVTGLLTIYLNLLN